MRTDPLFISRGLRCVCGAARHIGGGRSARFGEGVEFVVLRNSIPGTGHRASGHWLLAKPFSILLLCVLWRDLSLSRLQISCDLSEAMATTLHTLQAIDKALVGGIFTSQYLGAKTLEENGATYSPKLVECAAGTHERHACALRAAGGVTQARGLGHGRTASRPLSRLGVTSHAA